MQAEGKLQKYISKYMPEHENILASNLAKYSVSAFIGYLKRKVKFHEDILEA